MAEVVPTLPKVFSVNWFRQDESGKYIWPGFGANIHAIKWISERISGSVGVVATPVGNLPVRTDLTLDDVEVSESAMELLTSIDSDAWTFEVDAIAAYFTSLGDTVPVKLCDRLDVIKTALRSK
jgi:phosphoenolpyruvate carboxykinase (GTP)